jgi:hypothetical protein
MIGSHDWKRNYTIANDRTLIARYQQVTTHHQPVEQHIEINMLNHS